MRILLALLTLTATAPNVAKLILKPAQVGKGYVTRTLDLCGRTGYPSEKLRTTRLQVDYLKRGGTIGLSNEVVTYRPGGAKQAMREVRHHALHCPKTPIVTGQPGLPKLRVTITPVTDAKLMKGCVAVRVRVTGTVKRGAVGDGTGGPPGIGGPNEPASRPVAVPLKGKMRGRIGSMGST